MGIWMTMNHEAILIPCNLTMAPSLPGQGKESARSWVRAQKAIADAAGLGRVATRGRVAWMVHARYRK
jgi:hypothetical protein